LQPYNAALQPYNDLLPASYDKLQPYYVALQANNIRSKPNYDALQPYSDTCKLTMTVATLPDFIAYCILSIAYPSTALRTHALPALAASGRVIY
jgi:hypothetical protein